jgi:hypothetical protein
MFRISRQRYVTQGAQSGNFAQGAIICLRVYAMLVSDTIFVKGSYSLRQNIHVEFTVLAIGRKLIIFCVFLQRICVPFVSMWCVKTARQILDINLCYMCLNVSLFSIAHKRKACKQQNMVDRQ